MTSPALKKTINFLCTAHARTDASLPKLSSDSAFFAAPIASSIDQDQIEFLNQKIIELKLQLEAALATDRSKDRLAAFQEASWTLGAIHAAGSSDRNF